MLRVVELGAAAVLSRKVEDGVIIVVGEVGEVDAAGVVGANLHRKETTYSSHLYFEALAGALEEMIIITASMVRVRILLSNPSLLTDFVNLEAGGVTKPSQKFT